DDSAYADAAAGKCPRSSIVGTLPCLEAVLLHTPRAFTRAEEEFLDRGAACLIGRALLRGSHDEEREDEADWLKPCFPRFYLYAVLRGLVWLLEWAERRRQELPRAAVDPVVRHLTAAFPDGKIRKQRLSTEGIPTRLRHGGQWLRGQPAS